MLRHCDCCLTGVLLLVSTDTLKVKNAAFNWIGIWALLYLPRQGMLQSIPFQAYKE